MSLSCMPTDDNAPRIALTIVTAGQDEFEMATQRAVQQRADDWRNGRVFDDFGDHLLAGALCTQPALLRLRCLGRALFQQLGTLLLVGHEGAQVLMHAIDTGVGGGAAVALGHRCSHGRLDLFEHAAVAVTVRAP